MNLIFDIGNTRIKAGVFNDNTLQAHYELTKSNELDIEKIVKENKIKICFISSVRDSEAAAETVSELLPFAPVLLFSAHHPLPFKNKYKTPDTVGSDRLAAIAGAQALYPGKNVLVIDAGTCIKYNFINQNDEFLGGGISPGLQMRFHALNNYTARLPLMEINEKFETLVGTNSQDSILSGVLLGAIAEVDGIIDRYKQLYTNLTVVITGGDFNFFVKRLKNSIFAHQFLILQGLSVILDTVINE